MRTRFVIHFVRTKQVDQSFVLRFVLSAQNESSTPGLVSFCAPPIGAHKTKRTKTSVPRARTQRKTKRNSRPTFAHVADLRKLASVATTCARGQHGPTWANGAKRRVPHNRRHGDVG